MKAGLTLLLISFLMLFLNSCKQCDTCTMVHQNTVKVCSNNYASQDAYIEAVHQLESQGYTCL